MTWHDFTIYRTAKERMELEEWVRTRKLCHMIYLSIPEKSSKKDEMSFWPLPNDPKPEKISKAQLDHVTKILTKKSGERSVKN